METPQLTTYESIELAKLRIDFINKADILHNTYQKGFITYEEFLNKSKDNLEKFKSRVTNELLSNIV